MSVVLTHPDLKDQPIIVNEDAVFHYERSGWKRASKTETKAVEAAEAAAPPSDVITPPPSTPRKK